MAADIGPQLPPHLLKQIDSEREKNDDDNNEQTYTQGQVSGQIGPLIPDYLVKDQQSSGDDRVDDAGLGPGKDTAPGEEKNEYGPSLPPHLQGKHADLKVGPTLPPGWNSTKEDDTDNNEDDEEEMIGPKPSYHGDEDDVIQRRKEIEERANAMRDKLTGKGKGIAKPQREAWMTELPPELGANIGLAARTFKKRTLNPTEADRSVWTDTPADREKKLREKQTNKKKQDEVNVPSKRDLEMQERVDEHNRQHRATSLMEMHQEDRKKKKGDGPIERRPFDRSQDLDHRKMDKKATSAFIKTSKNVNSRFESSKFGEKFL